MITKLATGLVLVLVSSCYGRSEEEVKGWFLSLAVSCNKDFSVSAEELMMLKDHKIPDSANIKCLLRCIFKKADLMDDKGNYDLEKTDKWLATEFSDDTAQLEKAKTVFDLCKKVNDEPVSDGEKGCDRAYLLGKCLTENAPIPTIPILHI